MSRHRPKTADRPPGGADGITETSISSRGIGDADERPAVQQPAVVLGDVGERALRHAARYMRCHDDLRVHPQAAVGRQRLLPKDVKRRPESWPESSAASRSSSTTNRPRPTLMK